MHRSWMKRPLMYVLRAARLMRHIFLPSHPHLPRFVPRPLANDSWRGTIAVAGGTRNWRASAARTIKNTNHTYLGLFLSLYIYIYKNMRPRFAIL